MVNTVADLVDTVRQNRLLEPEQLELVTRSLQARFADARSLAKHLIGLGWLTPYQVNQIFQGKGGTLVMGSYIILERLGEGGMGVVFKARNWKLGRVVALKLIRQEHLANTDAVKRFRREIEAVAKLSHPNIVAAFDADQVGDAHFFVMEYVEGNNLSNLVKQFGPPPVSLACDYIRQVALGLQQAVERGMVHRDIKPANLLISRPSEQAAGSSVWGNTVKILDMGVARIQQTAADSDSITALTKEGRVVGTPDYMAPEQAVNSAKVDIRSDLYSLGCTFYHLLTGKPPYPGGTPMEKLLKHRMEKPQPIEELRPDLPPPVANIARKLMAKKAEERYQTPAELIGAIDGFLARLAPARIPARATHGSIPQAIPLDQPAGANIPAAGAVDPFGFGRPGPFSSSSPWAPILEAFKDRRNWPIIAGILVTFVVGIVFLLLALLISASRR